MGIVLGAGIVTVNKILRAHDPTEQTNMKLKYKGEKCCNREGGECALRPQRRTQTSDLMGQERPPVLEGSI